MLSSLCFERIRDLSNGFSPSRTIHTYRSIVRDDWILAQWYVGKKNWGDSINPVVIEHLSGKKAIMAGTVPNIYGLPVHMVIGSILETCNNKNTLVWGSGLISPSGRPKVRPKHVFAVRGPRTRDVLRKQGIPCPEVYGDPALIFPRIFDPGHTRRFKLGIVPHYMDIGTPALQGLGGIDVKIIDVTGDIYQFVRDICSCDAIASSSLHGLVAADAYRVPSVWIKMSDKLLGNDFKFYDYYEGIGVSDIRPHQLESHEMVEDIIARCGRTYHGVDTSELIRACPFAIRGN